MRIKKILIPTDFSPGSECALDHGVYFAQRENAELHVLHAITLYVENPHNPAYHYPDIDQIFYRLREKARTRISEIMANRNIKGLTIFQQQVRGISAAPVILDYVEQKGIDLIIMGTRGRKGISKFLLGSVAEEVVQMATCPVMTLRLEKNGATVGDYGRVLIPVDFSEHSKRAIQFARDISKKEKAQIHLLHVVEESALPSFYRIGRDEGPSPSDIRQRAEEELELLKREIEDADHPVSVHVLPGNPAREIVRFVDQNDIRLVVIATHGLTGFEHFLLGSVTEKVVRLAGCPVCTL